MAVRETLQIGNPLLKAHNEKVTSLKSHKIKQVIKDLVDTMMANGLIGIAAPQIGENYRLFITEPRETEIRPKEQTDTLRVYINPKIVFSSKEQIEIWEGCGCVANATILAPVVRPKVITVEAADMDGHLFRLKADGILGRVIQHEYDHMEGIEFVERITDLDRIMSLESYIKRIKPLPEVKASSLITIKEVEQL
ncbi:MAG: peptide deformylase [Patescibacteria group bacterium]|jgi:peptide deformylase